MGDPRPPRRRRHHHLDRVAQDYCQTLTEMQTTCEEHGLNFRLELMRLAEQWLAQHSPKHTRPDSEKHG